MNFRKLIKAETIFRFCYFKTTVLNDTVSETIITAESLKLFVIFITFLIGELNPLALPSARSRP